ncbi:hypothetical protein PVAND_005235 [Polypedilum vanderplanki]|uniref:Uncharacterized protein n=1 Tax=Polypedilum vanderplanki TaxID=319348 RepID=A0A9J6BZJ9_POLVA|nr:hypothetical protein PVAND_005235 [Polypedilum vanderplanki]
MVSTDGVSEPENNHDISMNNLQSTTSKSLVRYRLLSEPEISNLLKTTISNHSIQQEQSSHKEEEDMSNLDMLKFNLKDQQQQPPQHNSLCTTNDKKSQNRNNNNLVQT